MVDETAAPVDVVLREEHPVTDVSRFSVHKDQTPEDLDGDDYLTVERLVSIAELTALYPGRVASPPLGYPVPPVASGSSGTKRSRKRSTYQSPNVWSGPFLIMAGEIDPVLESSPVWKVPRRATRYPKWKTIRRKRGQYGCGPLDLKSGITLPGHPCEAARLASLYDDLPWGYTIALDAPRGQFQTAWNRWASTVLLDWESGPRPEYRGFYLVSLARHPGGLLHAHLLVGGIPYEQIRRGLDEWPFLVPPNAVRKVNHRWGALHYLLAQADPWEHRRDVFSYCPNVVQVFESDNLQALAFLTRRQIYRTASRKATDSLSARKRSEKARKAARARWDRPTDPVQYRPLQ